MATVSYTHLDVYKRQVFKPTLTEIETNVILYTDRRVYHVKLVSAKTEKDYMNQIGFYYPDEIVQRWDQEAQVEQQKEDAAARKADLPTVTLDQMDWGYTIRGGDKISARYESATMGGGFGYRCLP